MPTYIALLRGVNVGGKNKLSTQDFTDVLESLNLTQVKTYIQSGNAVFQTTAQNAKVLPEKLKQAIKEHHGFSPDVLILDSSELAAAIVANPFSEANDNPKSLHLTFLPVKPKQPDLDMLESIKKESEAFKLIEKVFYFYAPEGVGRSKAFSKIERALGVSGTARNWRTANKLLELARGEEIV